MKVKVRQMLPKAWPPVVVLCLGVALLTIATAFTGDQSLEDRVMHLATGMLIVAVLYGVRESRRTASDVRCATKRYESDRKSQHSARGQITSLEAQVGQLQIDLAELKNLGARRAATSRRQSANLARLAHSVAGLDDRSEVLLNLASQDRAELVMALEDLSRRIESSQQPSSDGNRRLR